MGAWSKFGEWRIVSFQESQVFAQAAQETFLPQLIPILHQDPFLFGCTLEVDFVCVTFRIQPTIGKPYGDDDEKYDETSRPKYGRQRSLQSGEL